MPDLYEREGNKLKICLHPGQTRAWDSEARYILVLAGTQGGKTSFGPAWLHREITQRGPGDYIAATATYDLFKLKMLPQMLEYFCRDIAWGTYHAGDAVIKGTDGKSRIILRAASSPGGLESATAKAAWCDEWGQDSVPVEAQEAIERRLSLNQGRQLITTTPYNLGWLKQRHYDRWVGGDPDYDVISFPSHMNPAFPMSEYERAKRILPDWKFRMFYDGEFSRPAGLIYGDYEDSYAQFEPKLDDTGKPLPGPGNYISGGCLVRPFSIPANWLRDVGVDFGGTLHNAQVWLAEDPEALNLYAYREVCGIDNTGPEQARTAAEYKEPVRRATGGTRSEDEQRTSWGIAGFPVIEPLIYEIEAGIDRVIGLFKQRRLFIFDTLTGLRSELGTYSRELDDAGEPLECIKDKDKYHRVDSLRYVSSYYTLDRPPSPIHKRIPPDDRTDAGLRARLEYFTPPPDNGDYF